MATAGQEKGASTTTDRGPGTTAAPGDGRAPAATRGERPGRALAALILGIISLPAAIFPPAGLLFGVIAVVLGATARTDIRRRGLAGHGQATAGMALGVAGIVLAIALWVVGAIMVS